jgi:hypothetical protein
MATAALRRRGETPQKQKRDSPLPYFMGGGLKRGRVRGHEEREGVKEDESHEEREDVNKSHLTIRSTLLCQSKTAVNCSITDMSSVSCCA